MYGYGVQKLLVEAEVLTITTNTEKICGIKTEAPPRLDFEN